MKKIDSKLWREMLISGSNLMLNNKAYVDSLNVFPVPDGDTGSNMGSTCEYASKEITNTAGSIENVSNVFARGMLMGARGNSGVILSQIFKGISVGLRGKKEATVFALVKAFEQAKKFAYKSVMTPIEGTILTVIRVVSEKLQKTITGSNTVEQFFDAVVKFAREAVDNTPNQLPVLKEVGVVDSGGEGLFLILKGMNEALKGKPVSFDVEANKNVEQPFEFEDDHNGEFGYCTEFIVEIKHPKSFNGTKFKKGLEKMGGSIGLIIDEEILKVHIHTTTPGSVFTYAQRFGEFLMLKSENMTIQANNKNQMAKKQTAKKEKVNIGIVAVHSGQGLIDEAYKFGATVVIGGGQSMNPAASDFLKSFKQINSDVIIILTNNSNIILAAQQAAQAEKKKKVIVLPTKTQMQGLSSLMIFDQESSLEENIEEMEDAIKNVKTGQITKASRTTKIKGVQVKEGEYLAIAEKDILLSSKSRVTAATEVVKKLMDDEIEIVTIYYGKDASKTDAEELSSNIEINYDVEIEIKSGKQALYDFLIAFE